MMNYKIAPHRQVGVRNDTPLFVFARHDSAEAISPSRCEGIPSFTIHNIEAIPGIATHLSGARKDKREGIAMTEGSKEK
jgi:hypothetical protein